MQIWTKHTCFLLTRKSHSNEKEHTHTFDVGKFYKGLKKQEQRIESPERLSLLSTHLPSGKASNWTQWAGGRELCMHKRMSSQSDWFLPSTWVGRKSLLVPTENSPPPTSERRCLNVPRLMMWAHGLWIHQDYNPMQTSIPVWTNSLDGDSTPQHSSPGMSQLHGQQESTARHHFQKDGHDICLWY